LHPDENATLFEQLGRSVPNREERSTGGLFRVIIDTGFVGEKGAMRRAVSFLLAAVASFPAVAAGQAFPVPVLGRPNLLLPPVASRDGQAVLFGSAVTPSGVATITTNLYVDLAAPSGDVLRQLTDFSGNPIALWATAVSLSPDGTTASYTLAPRGPR
jgi:hypothetical protein